VTQNGVPAVQGSEVTNSWNRLGKSFADVWFYVAAIPTYQGGFMAMGWASDDPAKRRHDVAAIEARWAPLGIETRYYTPAIHQACFALPKFVLDLMR
jgi:spermidine synthase